MERFGERRIGRQTKPGEPDDRFGPKPLSSLRTAKPAEDPTAETCERVDKVIKSQKPDD